MKTMLFLMAALSLPVSAAEGHGHGGRKPTALAAPSWTRAPLLVTARSAEGGIRVAAANLVAPQLEVYAPKGWNGAGHRTLPLVGGARVAPLPEAGNYYWLSARAEMPEYVAVASTAHYFPNPGPAPAALLLARKNELEIIPQPLPREHASYRAGEEWNFLVRFDGHPLGGEQVILETANGSRAEFVTDAQGLAKVRFPDDFKPDVAQEGEHGGRSKAGFVLTAEYGAGGKTYLTAFNQAYGPDAFAGRNLWTGVGFMVFGMACAAPLLRRKKEKKNA